MKKLLGSFVAFGLLLAIVATPVQAQIGVGIKIPPLILPQVYVSFWLNEEATLLMELGGSLSIFGSASSISVAGMAKLFLDTMSIADINLHPFLSGGVGVAIASFSVPGLGGSSTLLLSGSGGGGMEYRLDDFPLALFVEASVGLTVVPIFAFGVGGAIGARFEF
jgi:hypothetical protein